MAHVENVDLHVHTTYSDGRCTPAEVAERAHRANVVALAIADHDTMRGWDEKNEACARFGIEHISAVEISCDYKGKEAHIVSMFADPGSEAVKELEELGRYREKRMAGMLGKLEAMGIKLEMSDLPVVEDGVYGRPHLARALVAKGVVKSVNEAFARYLYDNGPIYLPKSYLTVSDGVELAKRLGGIPILAHPGISGLVPELDNLFSMGLEGLEAYYPKHGGETIAQLLRYCRDRDLLVSGGSDFHAPGDGAEVGSCRIPPEVLEPLRQAAETRKAG